LTKKHYKYHKKYEIVGALHQSAFGQKTVQAVTGLLTGRYTWSWHLHVMGLSDNAICRKCGQEESSYHNCCPCTTLAGHRMKILGSAYLELTDIRSSIKQVPATALRIELF
jgi:hypothetical protein